MRDTPDQNDGGGEDDCPMTLVAINEGFWLYEGDYLLNDLLFGRGAYPFKVRCVIFKDSFEMNQFFGEPVPIASFWRINPDVVDRLRLENLLVEVFPEEF